MKQSLPSTWAPQIDDSFYFQTSGLRSSSVGYSIQFINLFDASKRFIDTQHTYGARVICFFSAGSFR
jgi:hypothetical protein